MGKPNVEKMKAEKDVEGLIKALEDGDKHVRGEAAEALGKIRGKRAAEALNQVRKSPTYWVSISPPVWFEEFFKQHALSWPPYCCICLEPIGPFDFYEIRGEGSSSDGVTIYTAKVKLKIPYCNNCRRKVKKLFGGESQGVSIDVFMMLSGTGVAPSIGGITLRFRNLLYAKMFWKANKALPLAGAFLRCSTVIT